MKQHMMYRRILVAFVIGFVMRLSLPIMAATATVDGYTWTYRINSDGAEIYGDIEFYGPFGEKKSMYPQSAPPQAQ